MISPEVGFPRLPCFTPSLQPMAANERAREQLLPTIIPLRGYR